MNNRKTSNFLSRNGQFDRMRIWSSFRIDEIINNIEEKSAKGVDLVRAMIAATIASIPTSYCWVNDKQLGTFDFENLIPKNKKLANVILTQNWDEEIFEYRGGMSIQKCKPGQEDCTFFCSNSDCDNLENFETRETKLQFIEFPERCTRGYVKKGLMCHPKCEGLGMIECEQGICGRSKKSCQLKRPTATKELVESYVEFLGHIYSLKSNSTFGWSDPESFKKYKQLVNDKFLNENNEWQYDVSVALASNSLAIENFIYNFIKKTFSFFQTDENNMPYRALIRIIYSRFVNFVAVSYTPKIQKRHTDEIFVGNLDDCDIENWVGVEAKHLHMIDINIDENKKTKLKNCINTVDSLLNRLAPFMLFGYANGFAKPLCPLINTLNPYSKILR
jgi:hypothetical protein